VPGRVAVIHAGTHKTGTTAVQLACEAAVDDLAGVGVHYPAAGRVWGGHHGIAWQLNDDQRHSPAAGTLDDLARELAGQQAPTVFMSSEDFEYLYADPARLMPLRDVIVNAGYRPRIVLAFREPCAYTESLFDELRENHGYAATFDEHVDAILIERRITFGRWLFAFDRAAIVDGFAAVFGHDAIRAIDYEPADAVGAVLAAADVPTAAVSGRGRVNVRIARRSRLTDAQRSAVAAAFSNDTAQWPAA
jgi:hypothetical protein